MGADEGSRDAFTEMYRQNYRNVRRYIAAHTSRNEVDDAVTDTFLVAWRRFGEIPSEWTTSWLIGVARNVVRGRNRAARRTMELADTLLAAHRDDASFVDSAVSFEELDALRAGLSQLSDPDQEILVLAALFEMTGDELAIALEVSANAATVRLHRARQRLRNAMRNTSAEGGAVA